MKILLRNYANQLYVWKTAKYNKGNFWVDGGKISKTEIVSIMNDNRKNYVQCSSCGQIFRRDDPKFEEHKKKAITPLTCMNCPHLECDGVSYEKRVVEMTKSGKFIEKYEREVTPLCGMTGGWWGTHKSILSDDAISGCSKRQCGTATEIEIMDFFTKYPGAFDCIATIDSAFDNGYELYIPSSGSQSFDIEYSDDWTVGVYINSLGIVDRCYIWINGDKYWLYYSKKYDEVFASTEYDDYEIWNHRRIDTQNRNKVKEIIAKLYN